MGEGHNNNQKILSRAYKVQPSEKKKTTAKPQKFLEGASSPDKYRHERGAS